MIRHGVDLNASEASARGESLKTPLVAEQLGRKFCASARVSALAVLDRLGVGHLASLFRGCGDTSGILTPGWRAEVSCLSVE
jgi:hypothetical protein